MHGAQSLLQTLVNGGVTICFANLHNARRANTPLINIVGNLTTYHLQHDPPLRRDVESIVKGWSGWVCRSKVEEPACFVRQHHGLPDGLPDVLQGLGLGGAL